MELFRGKKLIIPRSKNWKLIDETGKYSKKQRLKCKTPSGKECTLYPFPAGMEVLKIFKPLNWLDPTAGWGDRLLGAMASDIDLYVGTDPNPCLHPNYKSMIYVLGKYSPNPKAKFVLIESPFETADLSPYSNFDLVYTSPPYFDYEKYSKNNTQSHLTYTNEDSWYKNFLQVSILKSIKLLKSNGYMVLYIGQEKNKSYMEKFLPWVVSLPNIYYLGCIFYSNKKFKDPHPIFIYKKANVIPSRLYNPVPIIQSIKIENNLYNIIRDDYVVGGTKTRAGLLIIQSILTNKNIKQLIYGGAANGYAQVCIGYCLYLLKRPDIKLILPVQKISTREIGSLHKLVRFYHKNTQYIEINDSMKSLYKIVDSYTAESDYIIPFGFGFEEYENMLLKQLTKHKSYFVNVKRLWLVIGSGTILRTLQKLLPNTYFLGVQVGREIKQTDIYDSSRLKLYVSSQKFYQEYNGTVNYHTVNSYDAKVLEFVKIDGQSGDYIWNVGGIHQHL